MPIAREGWPFILTLLGLGTLACLRVPVLGGLLVVLGLFVAFFFRDPERKPPPDETLVLAPADGKVVRVAAATDPNPCGSGATQVSIFLSLFDVHVNRAPVAGRIAALEYRPGQFLPAFDERASDRNEQNAVTLESDRGPVFLKQIAGLVARRVVFRKRVGEQVARGERVGLIKFGSRVDLVLPRQVEVLVRVGDRVRGGSSAVGRFHEGGPS